MEIRAENQRPVEARTLKDLTPTVAALLCYVGVWVTGINFLVLEQKNHFVRFHALQSIIVFGTLTLASAVLGSIPVIGIGFHWIIFVIGFILWIILMVKAYAGEYFKLPWAGDLAERIATQSTGQPAQQQTGKDGAGASAVAQPVPGPAAQSTKRDEFRARYYSYGARAGRITGSAFAIAWSVVLLIFFNFFNQYIAFYQQVPAGSRTNWEMHPLVTSGFNLWLPLLTLTLVLTIVGHALLITFDKYVLRQIIRTTLDVFGVITIVSLLVIFPFNFNVIPNADVAFWTPFGVTVSLIVVAVGTGIGALVRLIQLIVHAAEGKY